MLYDGVNLIEGSNAKNLVVQSGSTFPSNANIGELFYRSDFSNRGLWQYTGSEWEKITAAGNFAPLSHVGSGGAEHTLATTSAAGFVSGADKIKLNNLYLTANLSFGAGLDYSGTVLSATAGNLANIVGPGTYKSVQINAQGLVVLGSNPTTLGGYGIADAVSSSHILSGGPSHAMATTSEAGFMSGADKTKLNNLNIGSDGAVIPQLDSICFWRGVQTFQNTLVFDGAAGGGYSRHIGFRIGGASTFSWIQSMQSDRDFQFQSWTGPSTSSTRLRLDHSSATGNTLFVGSSSITYGGNQLYTAGNLSFGSGLSYSGGSLSAVATGITAGNGISLTSDTLALTGNFSGNTLYHAGNLSFGSGLNFSGGVLTASGGGGGGALNINYTPTYTTTTALTAGAKAIAINSTGNEALVMPFRENINDVKTGNTFTAVGNAAINSTYQLFGRNTLFLDGTGDYVQVATADMPAAYRLTGVTTFSIDCWLYSTVIGVRAIAGNLNDSNGTGHWWLMANTTAGGFATISFSTTGQAARFGASNFPINQWVYLRVVASGGQIACFTATTPGGTETQLGSTLSWSAPSAGITTLPFRLGQSSGTGNAYNWNGAIANFRLVTGATIGGMTAGTAPSIDLSPLTMDCTLPATISAGQTFTVRNSNVNMPNTAVRINPGASRSISPFNTAELVNVSVGEEITLVATSNTTLEIIPPQFDSREFPQVIRNASATFSITDRGKMITKNDTNTWTWTIPLDSSVNFPIGSSILLLNDAATANARILPTAGVILLDGGTIFNEGSGTFDLLPNTMRSLVKVGINRWRIN